MSVTLKGTVGNQRSLQVTAKPRGNDGISPEITVQEIENGHRVSMKDINGTSIFDVMNGAKGDKGDPGYTPVKGVDYFDGEKGQDGYTPVKGVDYHDGEKGNDGYTPVKGIDYFDGKDGRDGQDGKDGADNLLVVTVDGNYKASHTASEINTFVQGGGSAVLVWFSNVFHAKIITASKCQFGTMFNATTGATEWIVDVDASGKATFSNVVLASLKNPNAITFTGAVEATYDGSEAVSVEIPSDEHINNLINAALGVIENGTY